MTYFQLTLIKKNLEMLPADSSIDPVLNDFGDEADAFVDAFMGHSTPLTTVPTIYRHASADYAAGSYKSDRLKDEAAGEALKKKAKELLIEYKKGVARVTVFG